MTGHPKDANLVDLIAAASKAVNDLVIAVANKKVYRVGDQPTLQYTDAHVEALQYHIGRIERVSA